MAANDEMESLILWINSFDLTRPCSVLEDLSDGVLLGEIMLAVAPSHFRDNTLKKNVGDNWVLKETNVKKLVKQAGRFFDENLGVAPPHADIDTTAICKDTNTVEIVRLVEVVLAAAVQCDGKDPFVQKIMDMDEVHQRVMMMVIQRILRPRSDSDAAPYPTDAGTSHGGGSGGGSSGGRGGNPEDAARLQEALASLERVTAEKDHIYQIYQKFKSEHDTMLVEKGEKDREIAELQQQVEELGHRHESTTEAAKQLFKAESDRMRKDILVAQHAAEEAQAAAAEKDVTIAELRSTIEGQNEDLAALQSLRDELDEARQGAAQAKKFEKMMNKYKTKLQEMGDLKHELAAARNECSNLREKDAAQTAQLKKIPALQTQVSTYKETVTSLELQVRDLELSKERLETKLVKAKETVSELTFAKSSLASEVAALSSQLEEHTGGDGMLGDSLLGADGGESLGDVMAGDLRAQVRRLESENEILRAGAAGGGDSNGGGEEVTALQELLEDRNRVIRQYEEDIRSKATEIHTLEDRVEELEDELRTANDVNFDMKLKVGESNTATEQLVEKNREIKGLSAELDVLRKERDSLQSRLDQTEAGLATTQSEVVELRTKVSLMGQEAEDLVAEVTAKVRADLESQGAVELETLRTAKMEAEAEVARLTDALDSRRTEAEAAAAGKEALDARVAELEAESKAQMSELNVLLKDKTALQDRYSAAQDELRAQERKVAELMTAQFQAQGSDELTNRLLEQQQTMHDLQLAKQQTETDLAAKQHQIDALEESLQASEASVGLLQEEKVKLEGYLSKARTFIEDLQRKNEAVGENTMMAEQHHALVTSLQNRVDEQTRELEFYRSELRDRKEAAKREEHLIVSAFYELGLELQRATSHAQSRAEPKSWLRKKRQGLATPNGRR